MIVTRDQYVSKIDELLKLFKRSFGRSLSEEYFRWRFINNPSGNLLASIEIIDGIVVGNHSASPCILKHNDSEVSVALTMMIMTDPGHAGKGIFTKLAEELNAHMQNSNFALTFGFPNIQSHPLFVNRLQWIDVHKIPTMILYTSEISEQIRQNPDIKRDDEFELDYSQTQGFKDLLYVKKDSEYLRWRYAQNPVNDYSNFVIERNCVVSSYCVIKSYLGEEVDIVDLQPGNKDEAEKLLNHVVAYASHQNLKQINAWVPLSFFTHEIYEKMGFVKSEKVTHFGCRVFDETCAIADIVKDYSNWFVQMGDSDVY